LSIWYHQYLHTTKRPVFNGYLYFTYSIKMII
jgi:hypothetical protein